MTSKSDGNKIITLPNRQQAPQLATDRLGEPLHSIRELTVKRIAELVGTLFDNVDDALFDRAESAQSNSQQTEYFEGMREVRRKRQRVERLTLDRVSHVFVDFAMSKIQAPRSEPAANATAGLSLVEDHELEESLAISSMVAKAESRLSRHLYAVNRRLSALRGGAPVENTTNPIGPAQLCDAFRLGMAEVELELAVRIIIYKLFDRHVMAGLEPLYDEINTQLINAGVLPQLRHQVHPTGSHPSGGRSATAADATGVTRHDAGDGVESPSAIETEIYQTLRSLLSLRHGGATTQGGATAAVPAEPIEAVAQHSFAPTDLLSALQILQSQTLQIQARTAADAVPNAGELKRALLDQADRLHAGKAHVASVDEDTIDLVGMLFEFIVQDRNLPSQMQALLGRLQIPFLKVAILDRHLFTQKTHPARQLLDSMALACIGKSDDADSDPALQNKIRSIVETILRDFDDDMGLIERANKEFSEFLGTSKLRAELAEKRTAETVQGRERLDQARRLASSEVRSRGEGRVLPALIQSLLNGPFAQLLVLIALRQGEQSAEWKQALQFADALVWSAMPKSGEAEATRLKNLLPSMLSYLRQSLAKVAWQDLDIDSVVKQLDVFYRHQIESAREPVIDIATQTFAPLTRAGAIEAARQEVEAMLAKEAPAVAALVDMMDKSKIEEEPQPEAEVDQVDVEAAYLEQVSAMKVGTWVEFNNPDTGMKERAKLSWISPISSKYLFVDRKGLKVADKTVGELAAEFRASRVTLLDDSMPLFDRALSAVVERLKSFQPRPA